MFYISEFKKSLRDTYQLANESMPIKQIKPLNYHDRHM